jgi:hypothetical protein
MRKTNIKNTTKQVDMEAICAPPPGGMKTAETIMWFIREESTR